MKFGTSAQDRPDVARRIRDRNSEHPGVVAMTIVTCSDCGNRFEIDHRAESQDVELAAKQAVWLRDHFVWDHIQEQKHRASIRLPGTGEIR